MSVSSVPCVPVVLLLCTTFFVQPHQRWRDNFISIAPNHCLIISTENESQKQKVKRKEKIQQSSQEENARSALIFRFSLPIFSAFKLIAALSLLLCSFTSSVEWHPICLLTLSHRQKQYVTQVIGTYQSAICCVPCCSVFIHHLPGRHCCRQCFWWCKCSCRCYFVIANYLSNCLNSSACLRTLKACKLHCQFSAQSLVASSFRRCRARCDLLVKREMCVYVFEAETVSKHMPLSHWPIRPQ